MLTRPYPKRSGAVKMATRRCHRLRIVWNLREVTHCENPGHGAFAADSVHLGSTLPVGVLVLRLQLVAYNLHFVLVLFT